ncbi:MAG: glutamate racemase, partial [Acidimicrobiales bacterium]
ADETAFEVAAILAETGLGRRTPSKRRHRWCSSGDTDVFVELGGRLLGPELAEVEQLSWAAGRPA